MKAVIFDMDGVISKTNELQSNIEAQILRENGVSLKSEEITERYAGVSDKEFFSSVFKYLNKKINIYEIIEDKWRRIFKIAKGNIKPILGIHGLINKIHNQGYLIAVASASRKSFIELVISELKISDKFDVIVSSEEVSKGKPDPEIFLAAAKKLNVQPKNCTVIEDGLNGMLAAKKANMRCIALADNNKEYPADLIVKKLSDIRIDDI